MSERRGTKALETWCRRLTEGYPGVKVENMTTSWRDGLAFCAIIHHFRPDLIDFASLKPTNVYYNNSLAFNIAERQLGIPALLDAEDMVMYDVPDRLSILTYLSQFYQVFGNQTGVTAGGKQGTSQRIVPKRSAIATDRGMMSSASSSPPTKMASVSSRGVTGSGLGRREPCAKCALPVFLAERLNVGSKLYHRTCFRCARCHTQLSLANYYETETDEFCCETCPDEEDQPNAKICKFDSLDNVKSILSTDTEPKADSNESLSSATDSKKLNKLDPMRNRSLSDEEKSKGLQQFEDDKYSADFEHALEESDKLKEEQSISKARNLFLGAHLLNEGPEDVIKMDPLEEIQDKPPPLPDSEPPDISSSEAANDNPVCTEDSAINEESAIKENLIIKEDLVMNEDLATNTEKRIEAVIVEGDSEASLTVLSKEEKKQVPIEEIVQKESELIVPEPSANNVNIVDLNVNNTNLRNIEDQRSTASETMLEETPALREQNITKDTNRSSLVKSRMLLFESGNKEENVHLVEDKKDTVPSKELNNKDISSLDQEEIEARSDKEEKTQYLSPSEDKDESRISEEANKTVRSEVNNSDSFSLYTTISEDSPLGTTNEDNILTKSILENLSSDMSDFPLSPSIFEGSTTEESKTEISRTKEETSSNRDDYIKTAEATNANLKESNIKEYPEDLNPFDSEDDEDVLKVTTRKLIKPSMEDLTIITPPSRNQNKLESTNPFGSSDEEEEPVVLRQRPPRPPLPVTRGEGKKVVHAQRVSLNPFWSDGEEPNEEDTAAKPVPMPRSKHMTTPEPKPRRSGLTNSASHYDSSSSISSMSSSMGHTPGRKKKPAPPPPPQGLASSLTPEGSKQSSPSTSTQPSPKLTPRTRKTRKAPPPPSSTPFLSTHTSEDPINISPISNLKSDQKTKHDAEESSILSPAGSDIEKEKISKDEKNRNRQSQNLSSPILSDSDSLTLSPQGTSSDKSTHGKWKRKKGPAPARPVPQRRQIRPLPLTELRRELDIIEMQQQGLEKQGVKLEQLIREKCEVPGANDDTALSPEVEDLVLELFELVNEKNELFRRQAELMYLRRQQRLEEEHADLEYQIRCLMDRPERNKTDSDKAREEELLNRLLQVVERRNEIVECLEMDRVREAEEDQSISFHLSQLALKKEEPIQPETPEKLSKKEKKKMKKEKKLKEKGKNLDVDKDIDESETSMTLVKQKKKKKWF